MHWPMSWNDTAKAAALAVLAERTPAPARIVDAAAPYSWNAHDVWLSRLQPSHARVAVTSMSEQSTAPRD